MFKIVFSDIDGSIINSKHQVTSYTKEIVSKLNNKSIPLILVSARMPNGITPICKELQIENGLIGYSGGLVINGRGRIIYSEGIKINLAKEIEQFILHYDDVSLSIYSYDNWYCHNYDEWIYQEELITNLKAKEASFYHEDVVHKFLCMAKPIIIDKLERDLKLKYPNLTVYKSKDTYLEIMMNSVSKSKAIKVMLEDYHLEMKDTISFGDNYNDIDMLNTTNVGFVMGNAPQGVKDAIGNVIKSNDEDGIACKLSEYLNDK